MTALCLGPLIYAQAVAPFQIHDTFQNISFTEGAVGQMPPGWKLGSTSEATNFARIAEGSACYTNARCAEVQSLGLEPHSSSYLVQTIDAKLYRGKRLVYRAAVRAILSGASVARLQVHTHHKDGTTSVRDDMGNHPIKSGSWSFYEIDAPIAADARDIMSGVQVIGAGTAWIDQISLNSEDANYSPADEAVRALITRFADARNAHNADAVAATYAENGEYFNASYNFKTRGKTALAKLWGAQTGQAQRTIHNVDFITPNIAVAHVLAEFKDPVSTLNETFIAIRDKGAWTIQIHEAATPS